MKKEAAEKIKAEFLAKVKDKDLVKEGVHHKIIDIGIEEVGKDDFAVLLKGEDKRSGVRYLFKSLYSWLNDNNDANGIALFESMRE